MISKNIIKTFSIILFQLLIFSLILPHNLFAQTKKIAALTPTPTPTISKPVLPQMSAGKVTNITSPVDRDLFAAGSQVSVDTTVSGDAYVAGSEVNIKGRLNGNLIVAGGTVTISGTVSKNLIIAGGQVIIDKSAVINGYVLGAGNELTVSGTVNGPARFAGNSFSLTNTAQIAGDLEVYSESSNIDPAAKILGEKRITQAPQPQAQARNIPSRVGSEFSAFNLFLFLSQILVLIVLIRILAPFIFTLVDSTLKSPLAALGWGLIRLIILPFLALILLITIIGIPLGILTIFFYGLGLYLSVLISGMAVGRWLFQRKWINNENFYLQSIVGYLIIFILGWIPFVGPIIKFVALLFGLGLIFQWEKSLFSKKAV